MLRRIAVAVSLLLATAALAEESETIRLARLLVAQVLAPHAEHAMMGAAAMAAPAVRTRVEAFTPAQVKELEQVMTSKRDPQTTAAAAFALSVAEPQRTETAVESLLVQMDRMMFFDPHLAHQLIVEIGAPAVPTLVEHLDEGMVVDVVEALGSRAQAAVPALVERLGTDNVDAASALAAIGTTEAVAKAKPVLVRALDDPANPLAKEAVQALGKLGTRAKDAIPAVRRALGATDPDTRMLAAIALIDMGDVTRGVKELGAIVRSNVVENEFAAFTKLRTLGTKAKTAREDLLAVLNDPARGDERAEAAAALIAIDRNHPDVARSLRDAAADPALKDVWAMRPEVLQQIPQKPQG